MQTPSRRQPISNEPVKLLHVASGRSQFDPNSVLGQEFQKLASLEIIEQGKELTNEEALARMQQADVLVTMWGSRPIPPALAKNPGKVRYVLNITGTCRAFVPIEIIQAGIPVTNWGDAPAFAVAEGAMSLLLTVLKDIRPRVEHVAAGEWGGARKFKISSGTLRSLKIGLYGCGAIGQRFVQMVLPFAPKLYVFDPYARDLPEHCEQVNSLEALFDQSEAIVIWAGLTDETKHSVNAEMLAKLPDHGLVINAARGAIIDQEALFAELKTGRLRAGLDVLDQGDAVPQDHEARHWTNLILSCHDINSAFFPERPDMLHDAGRNALDNLKRFIEDRPLRFVMDERRYLLST